MRRSNGFSFSICVSSQTSCGLQAANSSSTIAITSSAVYGSLFSAASRNEHPERREAHAIAIAVRIPLIFRHVVLFWGSVIEISFRIGSSIGLPFFRVFYALWPGQLWPMVPAKEFFCVITRNVSYLRLLCNRGNSKKGRHF